MSTLPYLSTLTKFKIQNCKKVTSEGLDAFLTCNIFKGLKKINLGHLEFADSTLEKMKNFNSIQNLYLPQCNIND